MYDDWGGVMVVRLVRPETEERRKRIKVWFVRSLRAATGELSRQRVAFERMMSVASELARRDPLALRGLAILLGRRVETWALSEVLRHSRGSSTIECDPRSLLFDPFVPLSEDGRRLEDLKVKITTPDVRMELDRDLVLAWPWDHERLMRALSGLREGGAWGGWRQDDNHRIELWLPMRIGWVYGGNHSIAAGIAYGTGEITPEEIYDISPVYNQVKCDGTAYRRVHDGSTIGDVPNLEMAVLLEVGRMMRIPSNASAESP